MKLSRLTPCFFLISLLSGCVNTYTLVKTGAVDYGGLKLQTGSDWNRAPRDLALRRDSAMWTRDGLLLDRLLIIPAVPEGEAIFRPQSKSQALPLFRAGMTLKELEELTESSLIKYFGEGDAVAETGRLRPHRFGERRGALFDIKMSMGESPDYQGLAGVFVDMAKLYVLIYLAADPHYYEKHLDEARAVISGATL